MKLAAGVQPLASAAVRDVKSHAANYSGTPMFLWAAFHGPHTDDEAMPPDAIFDPKPPAGDSTQDGIPSGGETTQTTTVVASSLMSL